MTSKLAMPSHSSPTDTEQGSSSSWDGWDFCNDQHFADAKSGRATWASARVRESEGWARTVGAMGQRSDAAGNEVVDMRCSWAGFEREFQAIVRGPHHGSGYQLGTLHGQARPLPPPLPYERPCSTEVRTRYGSPAHTERMEPQEQGRVSTHWGAYRREIHASLHQINLAPHGSGAERFSPRSRAKQPAHQLDQLARSSTAHPATIAHSLRWRRAPGQLESRERALRQELQLLRVLPLQQRALAEGVDVVELENAMDSNNPKAALSELTVQKVKQNGFSTPNSHRSPPRENIPLPVALGGTAEHSEQPEKTAQAEASRLRDTTMARQFRSEAHAQEQRVGGQSDPRLGRRRKSIAPPALGNGQRHRAATQIAAHIRGMKSRKAIAVEKQMAQDLSATSIQRAIRGKLARRRASDIKQISKVKQQEQALQELEAFQRRQEAIEGAALLVQRWWRGWVGRRKFMSTRDHQRAEEQEAKQAKEYMRNNVLSFLDTVEQHAMLPRKEKRDKRKKRASSVDIYGIYS